MKKGNKQMLFAGTVITFAGLINYQLLVEKKVHTYHGFGLSFFCTALIGLTGYITWRRQLVRWPATVWAFAYIIYMFVFTLIMLTNNLFYPLPLAVIISAHNVRDIFNSPLPLLVIYFLTTYSRAGNTSVK